MKSNHRNSFSRTAQKTHFPFLIFFKKKLGDAQREKERMFHEVEISQRKNKNEAFLVNIQLLCSLFYRLVERVLECRQIVSFPTSVSKVPFTFFLHLECVRAARMNFLASAGAIPLFLTCYSATSQISSISSKRAEITTSSLHFAFTRTNAAKNPALPRSSTNLFVNHSRFIKPEK
jgi:hypothetical protein